MDVPVPSVLLSVQTAIAHNMCEFVLLLLFGELNNYVCTYCTEWQAKTIDLCNNPLHKEPKLEMARRLVSYCVCSHRCHIPDVIFSMRVCIQVPSI